MSLKRTVAKVVISGVLLCNLLVPAASASSVKVEGDSCTFSLTPEDQETVGIDTKVLTRDEAKEELAYVNGEVRARKAKTEIEYKKYKEQHGKSDPGYAKAVAEFEDDIEWMDNYIAIWHPVLRACIDGRNLSESSSKAEAMLSTSDGSLSPGGIGVVVGVLIAVLGGIAAALPMLKPMLPANIAAMVP